MTKRIVVAILLLMLFISGCSRAMIINIDGMPISNHEYNLTNDETKVRVVFVLAKYYREYEGKEYIIKPSYLDALHANRIKSNDVEQLILHVKVINLRKVGYTLHWEALDPNNHKIIGLLYSGKLSRKDFYIKLPVQILGDYEYSFRIEDVNGDDLFNLPLMRYTLKGGANGGVDQSTTR